MNNFSSIDPYKLFDNLSLKILREFPLCDLVPELLKKGEEKGKKTPLYNNPELFEKLKKEAINELAAQLLDMRKQFDAKAVDHCTNFNTILNKAAKLRREIAIKTETPDAEDFGTPRDELCPTAYMSTTLYAHKYKEINKKIKQLILDSFPKIKNRDKGICITEGISRYTFRLSSDDPLKVMELGLSQKDYNRKHEMFFSMMAVDEYKREIKPILNKIKKLPKDPLSIFGDKNICIYSGRIEILTNGEWRTLTRHFAIFNCNDKGEITEENIADFKSHGFVNLFHTNHEDFKFHNPSIAELFNKIINQNTAVEERNKAFREFEYRFHHMAHHKRGGQFIPESVIKALTALCPDYKIKGHLEALAEPFFTRYLVDN